MISERFIADRCAHIGSSGIRRVFDLAATMTNPINFSIGQPDFEVPPNVKQAMIRAIEAGHNGYTVTRGLPELRRKIAQQLHEEFARDPDILVTSGVSGGLLSALLACVDPGDEVLISDPCFVSYPHLIRMVGGVPVRVSIYEDFQLHPERFAAAITPKTKIIILCSPSNPTGVVHSSEDYHAISEIARRHDLLLFSDEIYHLLSYDGPAPSPVRFVPERTVLFRGFAKSYAMTGLRMGYAAGPPEIILQMEKMQQYTFVCAPHPVQYGGIEALSTDMSAEVKAYARKRNLVCSELESAFEFVRPSGGFYVFPRAPKRFANASEFVNEAIRKSVLLVPGDSFSARDTHFRLSYAVPDDRLQEGCRILRDMARG